MFKFFLKKESKIIDNYISDVNKLGQYQNQKESLSMQLKKAVERFNVLGTSNLSKSEGSKLHIQLSNLSKGIVERNSILKEGIESLNKSLAKQKELNDYLYQLPNNLVEVLTEEDFVNEINTLIENPQENEGRLRLLKSMTPITICAKDNNFNMMIREELTKTIFADAIIRNEEGKILFIKRNQDDDIFPGLFGLPGGHVEKGEDIVKAAIRELKEETNIIAKNGILLRKVKDGDTELNYVEASSDFEKPIILDAEETINYTFAELDELDELELIPGLKENLEGIFSVTLKKALDTSKLIRKQVQVKGRNGKIFTSYRWIDPNDNSPQIAKTKGPRYASSSGTDAMIASIEDIVNNTAKMPEKIRNIINLGIYNRKTLIAITGATYDQVYNEVKKADIAELSLKAETSDISIVPVGDKIQVRKDKVVIPEEKIKEEISSSEISIDDLVAAELKSLVGSGDINFEDEDIKNEFTGKDKVDSTMDTFINMVATGKRKFTILYGLGGIGKTWQTKQLLTNPETIGPNGKPFGHDFTEYDPELDPSPDEYDFVKITGKITGKKLYEAMFQHNGKLIMLDDADSVFDDPVAIDLMKGALDTTLESISYKASQPKIDGEAIPTSMKFHGKIVVITNLTEAKLRAKGASPLLDSRALPLDTSRTMEETIEKLDFIKDKMDYEDVNGVPIEVSHEARNSAVKAIKQFSKYLPLERVNARILGSLSLLYDELNMNSSKELINNYGGRSILGVTKSKIESTIRKKVLENLETEKENIKIKKLLDKHLLLMNKQ